MTTTKITSAAGGRRLQFFALDVDGNPSGDQSGANGYDGVYLSGFQSMSITIPDVQPINHVGDDHVFGQDFLPANTGVSATITTGKTNMSADATLTGTKVEDLGDGELGGMATDKQGSEIDVAIIAYRQAIDVDPDSAAKGSRRWQAYIFPKARVSPKGGSIEQGGADPNTYNVIPTAANQPPWGKSFTELTNGFTEAQLLRGTYEYPPVMERWTGNNTIQEFTTTWTPISVVKTTVFVNGASVTVSSVNTSTPSITLQSAPGNDAVVVAWFETSDDIG